MRERAENPDGAAGSPMKPGEARRGANAHRASASDQPLRAEGVASRSRPAAVRARRRARRFARKAAMGHEARGMRERRGASDHVDAAGDAASAIPYYNHYAHIDMPSPSELSDDGSSTRGTSVRAFLGGGPVV